MPVSRMSEVGDLSQVIHTVQHRKDLLGVTHEVRVDVIYMTWKTDIQLNSNFTLIESFYLLTRHHLLRGN